MLAFGDYFSIFQNLQSGYQRITGLTAHTVAREALGKAGFNLRNPKPIPLFR